jgi:hypothetical protein
MVRAIGPRCHPEHGPPIAVLIHKPAFRTIDAAYVCYVSQRWATPVVGARAGRKPCGAVNGRSVTK